MAEDVFCKALMGFTGLDKPTVKTQIFPYLRTLSSASELEAHLTDLLGPGSDQQASIRMYVDHRFRDPGATAARPKPADKAFPALQPSSKPLSRQSSATSATNLFPTKARGKAAHAQASAKRVESDDRQTAPKLTEAVSNTFENPAKVYLKTRGDEESGGKRGKKKSPQPTPASQSPDPTPVPVVSEATAKQSEAGPKTGSGRKLGNAGSPAELGVPMSQLSPAALAELGQLDAILDAFSAPDPAKDARTRCLCAATLHPQPPSPLPALCASCGLVYCELKRALSGCPSCGELDSLSTNVNLQATVHGHFSARREALLRAELDRYRHRLSREQQAQAQADAAERAFPSLPGASSRDHTPPARDFGGARYATQLTGGLSMEARIKQGYERLAAEAERKANAGPTSHTVLKLDSKTGKTKILTTTTRTKGEAKSKTGAEELDLVPNVADAHHQPWIDEFDDGYRKSMGLEPLLSITGSSYDGSIRSRKTRKTLEYIPRAIYTTET